MAAHEVHLKLRQSLRRNRDIGELSEARRHSIYDRVFLDDVVDHGTRAQHALPSFRRETYAEPLDGDGVGFIDGQTVAIDE